MQHILLLVLTLITLSIAQTPREFKVDFVRSGGLIQGSILGELSYSDRAQSLKWVQTDGYKELAVYSSDPNSRFRYNVCSGGCEVVAITDEEIFPKYYSLETDTCETVNMGRPDRCTVCNRANSNDGINLLCVNLADDTGDVRYVEYTNGERVTFSNRRALPQGEFTPIQGCEVNCYAQLDIVLVIDESNSISGNYNPDLNLNSGEWKQNREFAIAFSQNFNIAPNKVHMGIVQFSMGSRTLLPSPHITGDFDVFNRAVTGLTKKLCTSNPEQWNTNADCRGNTWTGHGLIDGVNILTNTDGPRAMRSDVGKILVMITDGRSYYPKNMRNTFNYAGQDWDNPSEYVQFVKDSGVIVLGVGIGTDDIGLQELRSYSSIGPDGNPMVFVAQDFDDLNSPAFIQSLGGAVCVATGSNPPCQGTCQGSCQCGVCVCPSSCDTKSICIDGECSVERNDRGGCILRERTCDDNNACTMDSCDPLSDEGCVNVPRNCDDGNLCTIDTCDEAFGCLNTPVDCDTGNPCTSSECNPASGQCTVPENICPEVCITQENSVDVLIPECRGTDTCKIYGCEDVAGVPQCNSVDRVCNDGNTCTIDACEDGECTHTPDLCDDDDACTIDTCVSPGGCVHTPLVCDDGNRCTEDSCDSTVGCVHTPIVCESTIDDFCIVGVCDLFLGCINAPRNCTPDNSTDCDLYTCDAGACQTAQTEVCLNSELLAAAIVTSTLVLTVVFIAVGAVVCAGATAGAVYGTMQVVNPDSFTKSGIYEQQTKHHVSAIHETRE